MTLEEKVEALEKEVKELKESNKVLCDRLNRLEKLSSPVATQYILVD